MKRYLFTLVLALLLIAVNTSMALAGPDMQRGGQIHYVSFGETLYSIAVRYGVTVEAILRQNGLVNPDKIYVGQPLTIPGAGFDHNPTGFVGPGKAYGCSHFHTVRPGETLSSVAYQNGTTIQLLLEQNNLYNQDFIYVGQRICIPPRIGFVPENAVGYQPAGPAYHTVVRGETLTGIAHDYGVDHMNILRANNMNNLDFIWAGQRLMIPTYQPAPQPEYYAPPSAPTYDYGQAPSYGPPPARPPVAPPYDATQDYDDEPPPYKPPALDDHSLPAPPDYQPAAAFPLLPLAEHEIEVVVNGGENWVGKAYPVTGIDNGITTLLVNIDEKPPEDKLPLVKLRSGDYEVEGMLGLLPEYGIDRLRFAFAYIPPGDYDVWLVDPETPSDKVEVKVKAGQRVEVAFTRGVSFSGPTFASPDGWFLASWENPSKPHQNLGGWSNILVKTPASGLNVIIESEGGGYRAKCFTGTKGPGACDFAGLSAGLYFIHIDGTELTLKTYMDGNAYATFEFARQPGLKEDRNKVGPVSYD